MKNIKSIYLTMGWLVLMIFISLLFIGSVPTNPTGPGTPADSTVSQLSAVTTASGTDVYYIVSGGSSKKITHATLMSIIRDSIKTRAYPTAGDWSFDGATFDAGSANTVTFNDSVVFNAIVRLLSSPSYSKTLLPVTTNIYQLGSSSARYFSTHNKYAYAEQFIVTNPSSPSTDTVIISYDGTEIQMGGLNINDSYVSMDSATTFDLIAFTAHTYTVPAAGDTIMTLTSTDRYSSIQLDLPGNMSPGISRLFVNGAQKGMIIRFYNGDASYTMEFEDYVGGDDNIYMAGDFASMGQYDFIEFQCVVESIVGQTWMETARSNN